MKLLKINNYIIPDIHYKDGIHEDDRIKEIYRNGELIWSVFESAVFEFSAKNDFQTFIVPNFCTHIDIDMAAAKGYGSTGGGGRVQCRMTVHGGQILYVWAGIVPTANNNSTYNASDIRTDNTGKLDTTSLQSRLVTAGGAGSQRGGTGGAGGNPNGSSGGNNGKGTGGGGATQSKGGGAGSGTVFPSSGAAGKFGLGGQSTGGAGGAGWYGGGSGGSGSYGDTQYGGGGGGSSYCNPDYCTDIIYTGGYNKGPGYVKITTLRITE